MVGESCLTLKKVIARYMKGQVPGRNCFRIDANRQTPPDWKEQRYWSNRHLVGQRSTGNPTGADPDCIEPGFYSAPLPLSPLCGEFR